MQKKYETTNKNKMNTYTDTQLKQALASMLPEKVAWLDTAGLIHCEVIKTAVDCKVRKWLEPVLDTGLLHLCWLMEESLTAKEKRDVQENLVNEATPHEEIFWDICHATWQQRTIALAKVKGVEIA